MESVQSDNLFKIIKLNVTEVHKVGPQEEHSALNADT